MPCPDRKRFATENRIVALTNGGHFGHIVINALCRRFGPVTAICETRQSNADFLSNAVSKSGLVAGIGQWGTWRMERLLARLCKNKIKQIANEYELVSSPCRKSTWYEVDSTNSQDCMGLIDYLNPKVVIVTDCRLLVKTTLESIRAPILRLQTGFSPHYGGPYGGYFALTNRDFDRFGGAIQLVNSDTDIPTLLYQCHAMPHVDDNIATYKLRIVVSSLDNLFEAVRQALDHQLEPQWVEQTKKIPRYPTLWSYLWTGLTKKVW